MSSRNTTNIFWCNSTAICRDRRRPEQAQKIIWSSIERYANHRVFARIILLEVRNSEEYFRSEAYALVRQYNRILIDIINEGIANGEIRDSLPPAYIRNAIFGAIEHSCLNRAIFNEPVSTNEVARIITDLLFHGIKRCPGLPRPGSCCDHHSNISQPGAAPLTSAGGRHRTQKRGTES